eukprot:TRINITY_DN21978_c0_g1_i1.p1 TRINITY_DN21978_c0_g1~~TRINITY_DN21978_c0_g1_i1.p1  ORF type:complete len:185 (-),score=30.19 TRINITY_DN21978_c0_g1_i1:203-757(-)
MRKVRRGYATLGHRLSEMSSLRECIKSMMVVDCGATPPGATCYRCFGGAYCDWRYVNVNDPVPRVLDRKLRALREELVRDANAYTQVGEECVLQQGPIEQVCALTDEALDLSTGNWEALIQPHGRDQYAKAFEIYTRQEDKNWAERALDTVGQGFSAAFSAAEEWFKKILDSKKDEAATEGESQ